MNALRNDLREPIFSVKYNLGNILSGKNSGLYSWDKRLEYIEDALKWDNKYDIPFSEEFIKSFEQGTLSKKMKLAKDYVLGYVPGMYGNERTMYKARKREEVYKRNLEIIAKSEKIYANAKKSIEGMNYESKGEFCEPRNQSQIPFENDIGESQRKRKAIYHRNIISQARQRANYKHGSPLSPEKYRSFIESDAKFHYTKEPRTDRINNWFYGTFEKSPLVHGVLYVAGKVDNLINTRLNLFVYGIRNYTPDPSSFELSRGELAVQKVKKGIKSSFLGIRGKTRIIYHSLCNIKNDLREHLIFRGIFSKLHPYRI